MMSGKNNKLQGKEASEGADAEHLQPNKGESFDDLVPMVLFDGIEKNAPDLLTRQAIEDMTGGILTAKSLANWDSLGCGITPRYLICRKIAYPKSAVIRFLRQRSEIV
jgi:hypothetical protein